MKTSDFESLRSLRFLSFNKIETTKAGREANCEFFICGPLSLSALCVLCG
jgi:hypothetical protein